jgi:anti-repressor protein
MNKIQIFKYRTNEVRAVQVNGEPWFALKDVCEVLGISNHKMTAQRLDKDEVSRTYLTDSMGRKQSTTVINESGLYNVILRSDKPEAKPFRKWVTSEVLPAIRKHGAYMTPETLQAAILNPDTMIQLCQQLKAEQDKNTMLSARVTELEPKGIFADAVSTSNNSILIGELAKILRQNGVDMGQNRLFEWMRENGYLIRGSRTDRNMPTQRSMELGLFEIKETTICHSDGHTSINKTPKVTGKGQVYFINLFLAEKERVI